MSAFDFELILEIRDSNQYQTSFASLFWKLQIPVRLSVDEMLSFHTETNDAKSCISTFVCGWVNRCIAVTAVINLFDYFNQLSHEAIERERERASPRTFLDGKCFSSPSAERTVDVHWSTNTSTQLARNNPGSLNSIVDWQCKLAIHPSRAANRHPLFEKFKNTEILWQWRISVGIIRSIFF